ncbi:MAG: AsmA family protein, partial [Nitratireductor sp.]
LKSSGKNSTELTRNLTGDLEISLQEGELDGVNLQAIKSQEGEKVVAVGVDAIDTPFKSMSASVLINRGVSWITKATIESEALNTVLSGKLDLFLGNLALQGRFFELDEADKDKINYSGSYFVGGTLKQPLSLTQSF